MKKSLLALVLVASFLVPIYALAYPGQIKLFQRNADDTDDVSIQIPSHSTSTYRVWGGRLDSDGTAAYYFGDGLRLDGAPTPLNPNNYVVSVDLGAFNPLDIGNMTDLLATKASTSTVGSLLDTVNSHSITIAGLAAPLNIAVFMGTQASTTPYVASSTSNGFMSNTDKSKIDGLATVATTGNYFSLSNRPASTTAPVAYEGTTARSNPFPIFKSVSVSSGTGAVHLTVDGTSGGAALCTNGVIQDSVSVIFNDATASFQQSWAFSNSNKTLTVTANKFTTANILSGVLGQASANGSTAKITVWCY